MRTRLISAAVLVPTVVVVFILGRPWTSLGIAAVAAFAAWEIAQLFRQAGLPANRWLVLIAPLALIARFELGGDLYYFGYLPVLEIALVAMWVLVAAVDGFRHTDPRQGFLAWAGTLTASAYASLLAFAVAILAFGDGNGPEVGRFWLVVLVLTVWTLDSAAYLVGRYMPRGKFFSHISPKKTWSGAIGGTVAAVVVAAALVAFSSKLVLYSLGPADGIFLGAVIAVAAQAGDLAESMLKRAAGAKDSGTLIPGHGGFLDRVDSFLFAAPAMFLALHLVSGKVLSI